MANYIPKIEYTEINTNIVKTITFSDPPEGDPLNEEFKHSSTVTTSSNGQRQTAHRYYRKSYEVEFLFQNETIKKQVEDFFNLHASRGGKFKYFIHSDETEFEVMEIDGKKIDFGRPIPDGSGGFEYDFKLKMSRVV